MEDPTVIEVLAVALGSIGALVSGGVAVRQRQHGVVVGEGSPLSQKVKDLEARLNRHEAENGKQFEVIGKKLDGINKANTKLLIGVAELRVAAGLKKDEEE